MQIQKPLKVKHESNPLLGIAFIASGLFVMISLISYFPKDPSWTFSASDLEDVSNWGGVAGSWLSDFLLRAFGIISYFLCLGLLFSGIQFLRPMSFAPAQEKPVRSSKRILGAVLAGLTLTGLFGLLPGHFYSNIKLGGWTGDLISRGMSFLFGTYGSLLLLLAGLWAACVLAGLRIAFPENIFAKLKDKVSPLKETLLEMKQEFLPRFDFLKNWLRRKNQEPKISTDTFKAAEPKGSAQKPAPKVISNKEVLSAAEVKVTKTEGDETAEHEKSEKSSLFDLFTPRSEPREPSDRKLLMPEAPKSKKAIKPRATQDGPYQFPPLDLLDLPPEVGVQISREELIANSKALEQKLMDFGIEGRVTNIKPGPIITLYEFEPAPGVKVKTILNLTDDLKLAMKSVSIRILAPIPGRAAVGIEIPNPRRQTVYLREILQSPLFQNSSSLLSMGMGKTTSGDSYVTDLAKMPHLLIAGATGSGKSVGLNAMIVSLLYKASPDELKLIMIDPKMLELSVYEGIPHLLLPVVTDPRKAARALAWAVKEMERRYKLISSLGARNLKSYNEKVEKLSAEELQKELERAAKAEATTRAIMEEDEDAEANPSLPGLSPEQRSREQVLKETGLDHYVKLPNIVVIIDELADLIMVAARDVEESIARLAQMARAAGIHLMIATQRPSVDVITGVIKANLPTRCAFQVASKVDSRTIIDTSGAENLIGDGDMLFLPPGTSKLERLHGPFISEDEIAKIVRHLKTQGAASYNADINLEEERAEEGGDALDDFDDELYDQALRVVFETQSPSASMIQRRLRVGYNRAARMVERMEREGIVSAPVGSGKTREILVTPSSLEEPQA